MTDGTAILILTAASAGFLHTILGADHYVPFIVMARAEKWPPAKSITVTFLAGFGHILSSLAIGFMGIFLGAAATPLWPIELMRSELALWILISFGLVYGVWGLRQAGKKKFTKHCQKEDKKSANWVSWILVTVLVLGPCEPLIPFLMCPAVSHSLSRIFLVAAVFGTVTLITMMAVVFAGVWGIKFLFLGRLERYSHALAGASISACGIAVKVLGL